MIVRALLFCVIAGLGLSLAGCGEKPQKMNASAKKVDAEPWTSSDTANPAFYAKGWTVGDKTAWEVQIRQRNQAQNDYSPR